MFQRLGYDWRVIWACMKKDIRSALNERIFTILSVFVPVNILILLSLFVVSGGQAPTAVVMNDTGPYAQQFYSAMSHAHSFVLQTASASEAQNLITTGKIVAVVTIPADFDAHIRQNQPVQVGVQINNLNTDFTNDIRRAIPLSITSFYAKAFPSLVDVTPKESDVQPQDTGYIPYLTVSILVVGLLLGSLLQSGTSSAREYENETIKELLLSPASRWAMVAGKMLGAFVMSIAAVIVVLLVLIVIIGVRPDHWGEVVGYTVLTMVLFIALGAVLGTLIKNRQPVIVLSFGISVPLFLLSGAFGPISFGVPATEVIAQILPIYYAIVLQQHAFHNFILNNYGLAANVLILGAYALVLVIIAAVVLRRSQLSH